MDRSLAIESKRAARVLVVDDHELVRSGLRSLIELADDLVVVGEAESAEEAVRQAAIDPPDLVIMDVRLPDGSGIAACNEIRQAFPEVKVLILSAFADESALAAARIAGASGYLLKNVATSDLVGDMRRVLAGVALFERAEDFGSPRRRLEMLSPQEQVIAGHLAEGLTNKEIARRMGLAEKTVKNYVSNVLTKLGMRRRSEAAAFVARAETMMESVLSARGSDGGVSAGMPG